MSADEVIEDRATVWSLTRYYAMCSEKCGWEAEPTASNESAQAKADQHNLTEHGIPRPMPYHGWRWNCARDGWMVSANTEENMDRAIAEHLHTHEPTVQDHPDRSTK